LKETIPFQGVRALVTGGAGVIGRELVRKLSDAGADVLSVDREPMPAGPWASASHVRLDLAVDELASLASFRPEVVFHLAAAFERSKETPDFWEANERDNLLCGHRVVDLARTAPALRRIVFASSYLIYDPALYAFDAPQADARALRENDPAEPRNLCGAAKLYTEKEIDFVRSVVRPEVGAVHARIFRVYGRGSRDVVSRWVRAALAGQTIELYRGDNSFDYVFAADVAEGLLRLAAAPQADGVVNLASGTARSVDEVLDAIVERIPATRGLVRRVEVDEPWEASRADLERLRDWTGWSPGTALEAGIDRIVEFERTGRVEA